MADVLRFPGIARSRRRQLAQSATNSGLRGRSVSDQSMPTKTTACHPAALQVLDHLFALLTENDLPTPEGIAG